MRMAATAVIVMRVLVRMLVLMMLMSVMMIVPMMTSGTRLPQR